MMPRAPPTIAPSPVLRQNWKNPSPTCFATNQATGCWCVSSHYLHPLVGFEAQIDKPPPTWFRGPNQEIVTVVSRPTHWQPIATGFEAKPENPRFSSPPCVWCGSHTAAPNLLIFRPPSTQLVPDLPQSSAPSLLFLHRSSSLPAMSHLPSTHHETSKHVSPNWITQFAVSSTEIHWIQIQTKASQLLITQINQGTKHLVSHRYMILQNIANPVYAIDGSMTHGAHTIMNRHCSNGP
jgi:hypothetical protein